MPKHRALGTDFDGELRVNGTMHITVEQERRKWWQVCWTHVTGSLLKKKCEPLELDVDVRVAWRKPAFTMDAHLDMLKCPRHVSEEASGDGGSNPRSSEEASSGDDANTDRTCKDLSMSDFVAAALRGRMHELESRVLRRVRRLAVASVEFSFEELTELEFTFHGASALSRAIADKLAQLSRRQVNHRGFGYRALVETSETYLNATANALIERYVKGRLGGTCFDA